MKLHLLDRVLKLHQRFGLPAMTLKERRLYKNALVELGKRGPIEILEYGSGYSTIYYAKFLKSKRILFRIHTIDNNVEWFQRVGSMITQNGLSDCVHQHLFSFSPFWEKKGWDWRKPPASGDFAPNSLEEKSYINFPITAKKRFDLIFIDGRFRRRCLEVAFKSLNPNGLVILHDAERRQYHSSLPLFKFSEMIESSKFYPFERTQHKIWFGGLDKKHGH